MLSSRRGGAFHILSLPPAPSPPHPTPRFLHQMDREVAGHTSAGVAAYREAAEKALQAAGLHLAEGGRLWAAAR